MEEFVAEFLWKFREKSLEILPKIFLIFKDFPNKFKEKFQQQRFFKGILREISEGILSGSSEKKKSLVEFLNYP